MIKAEESVGEADSFENTEKEGANADENDGQPEKTEIAGVRFKKEGKTYYFAPNGFELKKDDKVIVDTSRGQEFGYVAVPNSMAKTSELVMPLRGVVRLATEEDCRIHSENLKREIEAYNACIVLIDEHNPKMKLIDVECAFDRSKLIFYFSAEERVDFREIVKALAGTFHTRIEMRQIGIRDEAKMLGGLGVCGRPFCCSAFLTDFVQVSVKMAKEQNISLNAAKISGACGKLMCCLRYEYDTYVAEKALTPKVGARVVTPDGAGEVTESNPLAGIVKVKLDGKGDDAEQTVYVREDVVKEEEYNGETLTKTEIPKRGKSKEETDVFASFASVISGSTSASEEIKNTDEAGSSKNSGQNKNAEREKNGPTVKNNTPTKDADVKAKEEKTSVDGGIEAERNEGKHGGNNKRRKKHKGHNRGNGQGGSAQQNQSGGEGQAAPQNRNNGQNQGGQNGQNQNGQNQGSRNRGAQDGVARQPQNRQEQQNKNHGENANRGGQNRQDGNVQNGGSGQNQGSQGNRNKKKHFKPYHKRFGNGENKGTGQGGGQGQN